MLFKCSWMCGFFWKVVSVPNTTFSKKKKKICQQLKIFNNFLIGSRIMCTATLFLVRFGMGLHRTRGCVVTSTMGLFVPLYYCVQKITFLCSCSLPLAFIQWSPSLRRRWCNIYVVFPVERCVISYSLQHDQL